MGNPNKTRFIQPPGSSERRSPAWVSFAQYRWPWNPSKQGPCVLLTHNQKKSPNKRPSNQTRVFSLFLTSKTTKKDADVPSPSHRSQAFSPLFASGHITRHWPSDEAAAAAALAAGLAPGLAAAWPTKVDLGLSFLGVGTPIVAWD